MRSTDRQSQETEAKQRAAAVLFGTIALASAVVVLAAGLLHPRFDKPGLVGSYEERITRAAVALPPHGVIGYVSDDQRGNRFETPRSMRRYYLAQYALAPRILDNSVDHDLVLGNFTSESVDMSPYLKQGLEVKRKFGGGLVVFRRAGE